MDQRYPETEFSDVLIIGAGISGIGAAYRIQERNPQLTYTVLERRSRIGGTWDLHRYPGIRSDSDIFTLSFPWEPWARPENVADGEDIRTYLTEAAHRHGIDRHIRFDTRVSSANWDSTDRHLGGADRAERGAAHLPDPVPVLRHRLLRLRPPVPPGHPGTGGLLRHGRPSAAVARGSGLQRAQGRGDRQWRHRDQPDPVADREGRPRDDAAALADLPAVRAADQPGGEPPAQGAAPPAGITGRCAVRNVLFIVAVYGIARKAPRFSRRAIRAAPNTICPRVIRSTPTSIPPTTRGINGCA